MATVAYKVDLSEMEELFTKIETQGARFILLSLTQSAQEVGTRAVANHMIKGGFSFDTGHAARIPGDKLNIRTGRLARSLVFAPEFNQTGGETETIRRVDISGKNFSIEFGSAVPYARIHEFGFTGEMNVPEHQRTIRQAFGRPIAETRINVRAHVRGVTMPARPFLGPALRSAETKIMQIFTNNINRFIQKMSK